MADDKKDANSQRGANAPQPRTREEGASLSDVVDKLKDGNQEQNRTTEATTGLVANMMNIADSVERVGLAGNAVLDTVADKLSGNKLQELESKKEDAERNDKTNELLEELVDNTDTTLLESPKGFFGTVIASVAALSGALLGLVAGITVGLFTAVKDAVKLILFIPKSIGKFIDNITGNRISKQFTKLADAVSDIFKGIRQGFKGFFVRQFAKLYISFQLFLFNAGESVSRILKNLKLDVITNSIRNGIKSLGSGVKGAFSNAFKGIKFPKFGLADDIGKVSSFFKSISTSITGAVKPFVNTAARADKIKDLAMMLISPFKLFGTFFAKFFAGFSAVGKVIGRLFLPITIIMGIFDGIKGGIAGAAEEEGTANKFIGGITGAIKGILVGLVGMPLDLLKDLVGWIAGKLGFENAQESLKGFSFSGLIGNIIDTIRDFFGGVVDFVVGLFTFDGEKIMGGFTAMKDAIGNVLKPLLRSILPDPKAELFSIAGIASKAIPSFVYDYAGINKATGEMEPLENSIFNTVKDTGDELNAGSVENEANKNKSAGVTQSAVVDSSVNSSSAQTINIMGGQPLATANELRFQS